MITINLDEHSGEDVVEIMKLRAMGVPDELIQFGYNNTVAKRKEASENDARRTAERSKETGV